MMRKKLVVCLEAIAGLRRHSGGRNPDPVPLGALIENAGADGLSVHLCDARRPVLERDVRLLRHATGAPLNLKMSASQELIQVAYDIKPDAITMVREESSTGGIASVDVVRRKESLRDTVIKLREAHIRACVHLDPDLEQVRAAHKIHFEEVILDAGRYACATTSQARSEELKYLFDAARASQKLGMAVSVASGLSIPLLQPLVAGTEIQSVHMGQSIVARALWVGLDRAVRDVLAALHSG